MANYEVIVSNIGSVYSGGFIDTARAKFAVYKLQSINNEGRAAGEDVTIMKDGEPFEEFFGELNSEDESEEV